MSSIQSVNSQAQRLQSAVQRVVGEINYSTTVEEPIKNGRKWSLQHFVADAERELARLKQELEYLPTEKE